MGVTGGYGRKCWEFVRRVLVFRQFWCGFGEVKNGTELVEIFEQLGVSHFCKKFCEGFSHFRIDLCEKLWVHRNRLNLTGYG